MLTRPERAQFGSAAMAYNAMRQGDEVVVLLDGIAINRQDGRQSAIPFAIDSPEFAAFCREKLNN